MIIVGSNLRVIDNSGAKSVRCIRILNKSQRKMAEIGDYLVVTVKSLKRNLPKKKVSKGQVVKAVVLNLKKPTNRASGIILKNSKATVALIDREKLVPIGTRISPGVGNEIRVKGLIKILALSKGLL